MGIGVVAALLLFAQGASAATIDVETDADEFGTGPSVCALREAVEAARTNHAFGGCPAGTGKDTVQLTGDTVLTRHGDTATNADGDLDYDGGGKLKILGDADADIDYPKITQDFSDRVLEITHQKGVKVVGVEIEGGGDVDAGGAVRAAKHASLTLDHVFLHDNIADAHGGGVACEGCASLKLTGAFHVEDNSVNGAITVEGGGIWSDGPTTLSGVGGGPIDFFNAVVFDNHANPTGTMGTSRGAGLYVRDGATITDTRFTSNDASDIGFGGGIAMDLSGDAILHITGSTLNQNTATTSGGGLYVDGAASSLDVRRSAIVDNDTTGSASNGSAFGGGVFLQDGGGTIKDSAIDGNTATATAASDTAAGGGIFTRTDIEPTTLRLNGTSVTNNNVAVGAANQRAGGLLIQGRLEAVNSTIANNSAPAGGAEGGGLKIESSGDGDPSARLDFTTIKGNSAPDGDGLSTEGPIAFRATLIDQASEACLEAAPGLMDSKGFNVEEGANAGCELDAPTDSSDSDLTLGLGANGSFPVGTSGEVRQTVALTANPSSVLDIVPPQNCKVDGKELKADARGAPRPAEGGCDAGAIERTSCLGTFVVGGDSFVGTKRADQVPPGMTDTVLAQGGDDFVSAGSSAGQYCMGSGDDLVQPGNGDDLINAGSGRDELNYNNACCGVTGIVILMPDGESTASNGDVDTFQGIEDVQGSEGDDEIKGDGGANHLTGGGGVDEIKAGGGIDTINAKDGEADAVINCGPGDNAKEKAKFDASLDPAPQSC